MNQEKSRKSLSFTLIELLVVISVITILVSMLLPALNKAREVARSTKCLGNLKQTGQVAIMYIDDNKQYFPISWAGGLKYWPSVMGLPPNKDIRFPNPSLSCPSFGFIDAAPATNYTYTNIGQSYGVSRIGPLGFYYTLGGGNQYINTRVIKIASKQIAFSDSYSTTNKVQHYIIVYASHSTFTQLPHFRHGRRANHAYWDGHAGSTNVEELKRDYLTRPELIDGASSSSRFDYVNENNIKLTR